MKDIYGFHIYLQNGEAKSYWLHEVKSITILIDKAVIDIGREIITYNLNNLHGYSISYEGNDDER